ncbi:MAG: AraC family transcriptional regulator [Clostridia bacterium]|nr:AraC family transcriptional regulator [Clostridia bacterium]
MDWVTGLQKAINYIEAHLTEEIDYEAVAAQSFSSNYHFQRVFSILCGITLGEYIRNRRLSIAGKELAQGNEKVIDVALKYGYENPDSFAKAFQKFHGISPSQAKNNKAMLKSFSRLSVKISFEGGNIMNYRIETKPEMILTGYKRRFNGAPGERLEQEADFYITTRPLQFLLKGMKKENYETNYDIITNIDDDGFDFYIAQNLEKNMRDFMNSDLFGKEYAEKFEHITIPEQTYAVFETERCKFPTEVFLELRKQIYAEWLPDSGYEIINAPEIVVTHWFWAPYKNERYRELWIPVKKVD